MTSLSRLPHRSKLALGLALLVLLGTAGWLVWRFVGSRPSQHGRAFDSAWLEGLQARSLSGNGEAQLLFRSEDGLTLTARSIEGRFGPPTTSDPSERPLLGLTLASPQLSPVETTPERRDERPKATSLAEVYELLGSLALAFEAGHLEFEAARLEELAWSSSPTTPQGTARFSARGRWASLGPFEGLDLPFAFDGDFRGRRLSGSFGLGEEAQPLGELELSLPATTQGAWSARLVSTGVPGLELQVAQALDTERLSLALDRWPLERLVSWLPPESRGAQTQALLTWLASANASSKLSLLRSRARPIDIAGRFEAEFEAPGERVELLGRLEPGRLSIARAAADGQGFRLRSQGFEVPLEPPAGSQWLGRFQPGSHPVGQLALELSGSPGPLLVALDARFKAAGLPFDLTRSSGSIEARWDPLGTLRISGSLNGPHGRLQLQRLVLEPAALASVEADPTRGIVALSAHVDSMPLDWFLAALEGNGLADLADLEGERLGLLDLDLEFEDQAGHLDLSAASLDLGQDVLGALDLGLEWAQGRLSVTRGSWHGPHLDLALSGAMDLPSADLVGASLGHLAFSSSAFGFLQALSSGAGTALGLGDLEIELKLQGTANAPQVALTGGAAWSSQTLGPLADLLPEARGRIAIDGLLGADGAQFQAEITARGKRLLSATGRADSRGKHPSLELTSLEAFAPERVLWLEAPLRLDLESLIPEPGRLGTPAGSIGIGPREPGGPSGLAIQATALELSRLPYAPATIFGQLARLVDAPLAIRIDLSRGPAGARLEHLVLDWGPDNQIQLDAGGGSDGLPLFARGSVRLGQVDPKRTAALLDERIPGISSSLAGLKVAIEFDFGPRLEVSKLEIALPGLEGGLIGSGSLGLSFEQLLSDPLALLQAEGRLALDGELSDLSLLAQRLGELERSSGRLVFEGLEVQQGPEGTTGSGRIRIEDGQLNFTNGAPAATNVQAQLTWKGSDLFVDKISGELGSAPLEGNGRLGFRGPDAPDFDLFVNGQALPLVRTQALRLRADAALHLSGNLNRPRLEGTLKVIDGLIVRSGSLAGSVLERLGGGGQARSDRLPGLSFDSPPWSRTELDLTVTGENPVRLDAGILIVGLEPDLRLLGTLSRPEPEGAVYIRPGRISLPATTVEITGGAVLFSRGGAVPSLEVTGRARQKGYDLNIAISGSPDEPVIEVSSVPPLPPRDALLLLTTGLLPDQSLSAEGGAQTARLLAIYLAQDFSRTLFGPSSDSTSLERFEFSKGRDVADDGTETIESSFLLKRGVLTSNGRLLLTGEYDVYKQVNFGLRWALRWH